MAGEELLDQTLVQLGDSLVADYDIVDLLTVIAERTVDLAVADATGILVDDDGDLRLMAASSETAQLLELIQLQSEEGPCLEAFTTGQAVVHGDLAAATERWPQFAPAAVSAGFASVCALPLRLGQRSIGAFNLFRAAAGEMEPAKVVFGQTLAGVASAAILRDQAIRDTEATTGQLRHALASRVVIEQAKGMISGRAKVGMDEAFARLRSYARSHKAHLTDVAREVTTGGPLLDELANPPPSSSLK